MKSYLIIGASLGAILMAGCETQKNDSNSDDHGFMGNNLIPTNQSSSDKNSSSSP